MSASLEAGKAETVMAALLPDVGERTLVLNRLMATWECAESAVPGVSEVTLSPKGFCLNVGQVEVLVFQDGILHLNLHGRGFAPDGLLPYLRGVDYKSISQPQCAFFGSPSDLQRWESEILLPHHEFVKLAALSPTGKPRKGTPFARFHSAGLLSYARHISSHAQESEHFIAYHSAKVMGFEYEAQGKFEFLSAKVGLLKKAIGNRVWVVNGSPTNGGTRYSLRGVYTATLIEFEDESSQLYRIHGNGMAFLPPLELNEMAWFPGFLKSQSNFSFGFNRISDPQVLSALMDLESSSVAARPEVGWPDIDLPFPSLEGSPRLVLHLRRERDPKLVKAKKAAVLQEKGQLACEACGFDFSATYGKLGDGFCEVHHRVPLSSSDLPMTTVLKDLAVLCSNCHRMIHRTSPMSSVEKFSADMSL